MSEYFSAVPLPTEPLRPAALRLLPSFLLS